MDAKKIGKKLVDLRGIRTRRGVAGETGVSYSALCNYECGYRVPPDETKIILAKYYKVPVGELFFNESNHET